MILGMLLSMKVPAGKAKAQCPRCKTLMLVDGITRNPRDYRCVSCSTLFHVKRNPATGGRRTAWQIWSGLWAISIVLALPVAGLAWLTHGFIYKPSFWLPVLFIIAILAAIAKKL